MDRILLPCSDALPGGITSLGRLGRFFLLGFGSETVNKPKY